MAGLRASCPRVVGREGVVPAQGWRPPDDQLSPPGGRARLVLSEESPRPDAVRPVRVRRRNDALRGSRGGAHRHNRPGRLRGGRRRGPGPELVADRDGDRRGRVPDDRGRAPSSTSSRLPRTAAADGPAYPEGGLGQHGDVSGPGRVPARPVIIAVAPNPTTGPAARSRTAATAVRATSRPARAWWAQPPAASSASRSNAT